MGHTGAGTERLVTGSAFVSRLCAKFKERMNEIESDLQEIFPPIVEERYSEKTGKAKDSNIKSMYSTLGRDSRLPKDLHLRVQFGPNSLRQVSRLLMKKRSRRIIMYPKRLKSWNTSCCKSDTHK